MDDLLRKLADEPMALPGEAMRRAQSLGGPKIVKRRVPVEAVVSLPKLTRQELREREAKAAASKLEALLDYYATTDIEPEHIAKLLGVYRFEPDGVDEEGNPKSRKVLDVERVEASLKWRRDHAE